jgi:hypothetical protein
MAVQFTITRRSIRAIPHDSWSTWSVPWSSFLEACFTRMTTSLSPMGSGSLSHLVVRQH